MDLKLPRGKACVQVAHASVDAVLSSDKSTVDEWLSEGGKKSVLKVADKRELVSFIKLAKKESLTTSLIRDAGKTFFKKPGFLPAPEGFRGVSGISAGAAAACRTGSLPRFHGL